MPKDLGAFSTEIDGQLAREGADSISVGVAIDRAYRGTTIGTTTQVLFLGRSEVVEVRKREFSRSRTILVSAGTVVGFGLLAAGIAQLVDPNGPPQDQPPPPPPAPLRRAGRRYHFSSADPHPMSRLRARCVAPAAHDGLRGRLRERHAARTIRAAEPNQLTRTELVAANSDNLYDAIAKLRPEWLSSRGPTSVSDSTPTSVNVFMDGSMLGKADYLKQLYVLDVAKCDTGMPDGRRRALEWDTRAASSRFCGSDCGRGQVRAHHQAIPRRAGVERRVAQHRRGIVPRALR